MPPMGRPRLWMTLVDFHQDFIVRKAVSTDRHAALIFDDQFSRINTASACIQRTENAITRIARYAVSTRVKTVHRHGPVTQSPASVDVTAVTAECSLSD